MLWIACTHPHACAHVPQRGHRQTQARHSAQCQYELRPGVHRGIVNTGSLTSAHDCLKHKQHAARRSKSVCFRRDAEVSVSDVMQACCNTQRAEAKVKHISTEATQ